MTRFKISKNTSVQKAVLDKVSKEKRLALLTEISQTALNRCVLLASDVGFFRDVVDSQNSNAVTILFVGNAHGLVIANYLERMGYTQNFLEGSFQKAGVGVMNDFTKDDTPIDDTSLRARLKGFVESLDETNRHTEL